MAPKPSPSLLFHPKKPAKQEVQSSPTKVPVPNSRPKPTKPSKDDDDEELKLPDVPFQEFRLLSSALNGWKYDVMKFDSRRPVDIFRWTRPIKLNRKDLRRDEPANNVVPEAVAPMLGPDGKPVIGADGRAVMLDSEGRPIHTSNGTAGSSQDKGGGKAAKDKKRFTKKTRQVYFVPEEVRQLRREERYPWVMEDSSPAQGEVWIGQMEEASKSDTHAFFMPAANDVFKFVPAHRWYKFQKRLKHDLPTDSASMESLFNLTQKRDPQAWLATRNGGKGPSAATSAMFKAEAEGRTISIGGSSLVHSSGQSLAPGGRRLKAVDKGANAFDEDDEEGGGKRHRSRGLGEDGDLDEQVYEEDFADDEEKIEMDENDEEAKELEERLKKEYKSANKQRDTGVDESDEEEELPGTSKQAKAIQKLIRNREGNEAYESDEEKNPYASSEEEQEEEPPVVLTAGPAIQQQQQQVESKSQTQTPKAAPPRPAVSTSGSRAASPTVSPGHGGHSVVAKRATSPKVPKPKTGNTSRSNSPLGSQTSPLAGSRATSPIASDMMNGIGTNQKLTLKRKADDAVVVGNDNNAVVNEQHKTKKRKAPDVIPIEVSSEELERLLVEWLKNTTGATTKDCIKHFGPYIADKRPEFASIVRKVAQLKNGVLICKPRGTP